MLLRKSLLESLRTIQIPRQISSTAVRSLVRLPDDSVGSFREHAFKPELPALLPKGSLKNLPGIGSWFDADQNEGDVWRLKPSYLSSFGTTIVPLELTRSHETSTGIKTTFEQFEAPLSYFISWCELQTQEVPTDEKKDLGSIRLYLAQASLSNLPDALKADLPTPTIVHSTERGDVYDANVWIGIPPTYTPLHKDPNPNLFVQLAGRKIVRLYEPDVGREMFEAAQMQVQGSASAVFRGSEMMQGNEKEVLEDMVWGKHRDHQLEAQLESGDAIFIPKGWWHSIKGVGKGLTASVDSEIVMPVLKTCLHSHRQIGGFDRHKPMRCSKMMFHYSPYLDGV